MKSKTKKIIAVGLATLAIGSAAVAAQGKDLGFEKQQQLEPTALEFEQKDLDDYGAEYEELDTKYDALLEQLYAAMQQGDTQAQQKIIAQIIQLDSQYEEIEPEYDEKWDEEGEFDYEKSQEGEYDDYENSQWDDEYDYEDGDFESESYNWEEERSEILEELQEELDEFNADKELKAVLQSHLNELKTIQDEDKFWNYLESVEAKIFGEELEDDWDEDDYDDFEYEELSPETAAKMNAIYQENANLYEPLDDQLADLVGDLVVLEMQAERGAEVEDALREIEMKIEAVDYQYELVDEKTGIAALFEVMKNPEE